MKYLLTLLAAILVVALVATVQAAGIEYSTSTKPVRCQNPTTNTDGSPVTNIIESVIYVGRTAGDTVNYDLKMAITGGCADGVTQDISGLTPGVQYFTYGQFVTAGGTAAMSNSVGFTRKLPLPNPLQMLE